MPRYVIGPDVALTLARSGVVLPAGTRLLAPTLLRSQVLAQLYGEARQGRLDWKQADRQLEALRKLNIRLLGDRSLQQQAWRVAERQGWADTWVAEYVALTLLQADALVVGDAALRQALAVVVPTVDLDTLLQGGSHAAGSPR